MMAKRQVIRIAGEVVQSGNANSNKLYAFRRHVIVYMLHTLSDDTQYQWLDVCHTWGLNNSDAMQTLQEAIDYAIGEGRTVWEFDTIDDFADWIKKGKENGKKKSG
jgi:hypothetical protein